MKKKPERDKLTFAVWVLSIFDTVLLRRRLEVDAVRLLQNKKKKHQVRKMQKQRDDTEETSASDAQRV